MEMAVRLSHRTNEYFIKFLKQWLISDTVASYFVFDLQGFEFLLDTIGIGSDPKKEGLDFEIVEKEEEKVSSESCDFNMTKAKKTMISLTGSDL